MRNGIDSALLGLGRSSITELSQDDLIVPPGFTRALESRPALSRTFAP